MIDTQAVISMIEWRQKQRSFLKRLLNSEPSPRHVPMFRLWQSPEYLILLVESEVAALASIGVDEREASDLLGAMFQIEPPPVSADGLLQSLLREYFPDYLAANAVYIPEMRRMAAQSAQEQGAIYYPPEEWLGDRISPAEFRSRMAKPLGSLSIFPRSEFDAQLLHFVVMMRAGGDIFEFSSPGETWQHMMGRGGIALVSKGRSIAYIETIMN